MELLKEAKGGNREAFDKLLEEYRHIFYKTARIYFREDYSATAVLEKTIHDLYRNLVDCRNEYEFKLYGIELILKYSAKQLEINENTKLEKFKQKSLTAGLSDESRIVSSIADDERDRHRERDEQCEKDTSLYCDTTPTRRLHHQTAWQREESEIWESWRWLRAIIATTHHHTKSPRRALLPLG